MPFLPRDEYDDIISIASSLDAELPVIIISDSEESVPAPSNNALLRKRSHSPDHVSVTKRSRSYCSSLSSANSSGDDVPIIQDPQCVALQPCHVRTPGLAFPRSIYDGWTSPLPLCAERIAIDLLTTAFLADAGQMPQEYTIFQMDDFSVYRPPTSRHANEMATLDKLLNNRFPRFLIDGVLSVGNERYYVQAVPFETLTVDGYLDVEQLDEDICIQSIQGGHHNVWYRLGKPSLAYKRFYDPFLWLTRFTKLFVDFLSEHEAVNLEHFRHRFYKWLTARYLNRHYDTIVPWLSRVHFRDFRTTVHANVAFLYKECYGIDDHITKLLQHPLWEEIDTQRLRAIPKQPQLEAHTIVTPFAYECFRNMYFGDQMEARKIQSLALRDMATKRKRKLRLTCHDFHPAPAERPSTKSVPAMFPHNLSAVFQIDVQVGDVVAVKPFGDSWKTSLSTEWYAYVQRVRISQRTQKVRFDVIWLYEPGDTTLGQAYYPFKNELFLSDNCDCGRDALRQDQIISKISVSWFADDPFAQTGLFVRRKYRTVAEDDTYDFVDLRKDDFECKCGQLITVYDEIREQYTIGDTILFQSQDPDLQVGQILGFRAGQVQLRHLRRKSMIYPRTRSRPNELIICYEQISIPPEACIRVCHVRYFTSDNVPTPYDRDGTGDYFFIVRPENDRGHDDDNAGLLNQGWNPLEPIPNRKLKGMGLFCGGGTFDRGLQEGGAVQFGYAIDYAERALHSYRANAERDTKLFLGSVDDYLAQAIAGTVDDDRIIAQPGDVDLISAGSPCQGFSFLQTDKNSIESRRNASKIASVVSFVDLYSPKYLILENVVALTAKLGPRKDQNVFSQLLAALVALGYQVQQFLMDSRSFGSPQRRSRVFIVASAPGLPPLETPPVSHGHPVNLKFNSAALGVSSNGMRFGVRHDHFTPFGHVSASESVKDLPEIDDAQVHLCPKFPDHRTATEEVEESRHRIAMVPILPRMMGLIQARDKGLLRGEPREWCERVNAIRQLPTSKVYRRINPDGLIPTITTKLIPLDGINGTVVHWQQHRVLTVMEARRAQGFPDHEVIIGTPAQQLEIIGNSVERNTALVLGLRVRESWVSSGESKSEIPLSLDLGPMAKAVLEETVDKTTVLATSQVVVRPRASAAARACGVPHVTSASQVVL